MNATAGIASDLRTLWRLLGPRLRGSAPPADPLVAMGAGMQQLAHTKADQQLAQLLQQLVPQGSAS
jgi:UDP-N-acetylglucosamine--N-acetylmuramyl-(pentapeptide) pyrophosphoryl-undecaprenol N-acetylglucosamine transferase